jgi:hypothetical protein
MFPNPDGVTWRLCAQPLAPAERAAVPEIARPPSKRDLDAIKAQRWLAEPMRFASGLPDRWGKS